MPLSRKKACFLCRESKARCDRAIPECSRCATRKLSCVYDGRDGFQASGSPYPYPYPSRAGLQSLLRQDTIDPVALLGDQQEQDDALAGFLSPSDEAQESSGVDQLAGGAWTGDALMGGQSSLLEPDLIGDTFAPQKGTVNLGFVKPWGPVADLQSDSGIASQDSWIMQEIIKTSAPVTQKDLPVLTSNANTMTPTTDKSSSSESRTLLRRHVFRTCTMSSILLGQVTSYPKMMIEGDQLPPFIHAPCRIDNELASECGERGSHQCLPRELAICASLVKMFYERTKANADFVWTSIYEQRARLQREYFQFSKTQQLAALQSALVLLLLQASDRSTIETNDSAALLSTALCLVRHVAYANEWVTDARDTLSNRREWVFRESIRRVVVVLYIVDMLLDGFAHGGCPPEPGSSFRTTPLPSSRDLWEARTSRAWIRDYKQYIAARRTDKVLTVGDVLESGGVSRPCSGQEPTMPELLPEVMRRAEGLDSLGMLVWMTMPFQDAREKHERDGVLG